MTYSQVIEKFLAMVARIKATNPKYQQPGDGSNGVCDCIGLPIGAIRRMGLKWTGIHGTNWAARKEFVELKPLKDISELELGDVVIKAYMKGEKGWTLDKYSRYLPGGKYYNGDLTDYYHAGVVTSVKPFNITHMSTHIKVDTKKYDWDFYGKLKILVNAANDVPPPEPGVLRAVLVAPSGRTVNLRSKPTTKSSIIKQIPLGETVIISEPGEEWAAVQYGERKGYIMAKFLDIVGDGKGLY